MLSPFPCIYMQVIQRRGDRGAEVTSSASSTSYHVCSLFYFFLVSYAVIIFWETYCIYTRIAISFDLGNDGPTCGCAFPYYIMTACDVHLCIHRWIWLHGYCSFCILHLVILNFGGHACGVIRWSCWTLIFGPGVEKLYLYCLYACFCTGGIVR